jgi:serine/threonine protein kinase/tetratricopeptide (TPR) repeat protein
VLNPGTTLGRYEIRSRLGAGGMGEVYLARDARLDRNVALKVLPEQIAADAERMTRFEQEARAASALNHPNIITIYEIDRAGSTPFIVTEFIDGATLRDRGVQPMPLEEVLNVATQVASALAAAHANGIVHRDIKPENIIVRPDGIVKVLDFGLAKLTGQELDDEAQTRAPLKTAFGAIVGTAAYMSPEQARGAPIDPRTDIFSLGVVLYELLARRLPFEGSNIYEIVAAILSDREAPPLSHAVPNVPAELERIVGKALRKDREERYQSTKDLLVDLQSLRQRLAFGREHPTTPSGTLERMANAPGGSRSMRASIAAAVLLVLLAAVGYGWWRPNRTPIHSEITSLAVLPLKSLDAEENYLGLGIADATIRRVSQTGRVIVRPTSAVRRYLNADTDALAAAKELGVDSVLEGSLQRSDDRLRVSVNLLRSDDGSSLWSDSFDIRMADIFAVQDTVAQQVAARLRLQLDPSQRAQLTKQYTSNPLAYDYYLKGVYNFDQRRSNARVLTSIAIGFFQKAIEADPNFALAHAQLAYVYATRAVFLETTNTALVAQANDEIARAEAIDPRLAETHLVRYQLLYSQFNGYNGEAATREVLLANHLNPNVGDQELAYMYSHLGLEDLATRALARASEIDPTNESLRATRLLLYEVQSRYDDYGADKIVRPDNRLETLYLISKGRLNEAQAVVDAWAISDANASSLAPSRLLVLAAKGDFHGAEAAIPSVLAQHPLKDPLYHHVAYDIACVYAMQGKSVDAVKWLRESAVTGYHLYPRYTRDVRLDRIRQSPEFIQLLAEMKAENDRYRREFS